MTAKPTTIAAYLQAAPPEAQAHLRCLYAILKAVAPDAQETIKWGTPFFVEPRFLFAFAAHKSHCSLAPPAAAWEAFRDTLPPRMTTQGTLKLAYAEPLPEDLVRRIAEHSVQVVRDRRDDAFW